MSIAQQMLLYWMKLLQNAIISKLRIILYNSQDYNLVVSFIEKKLTVPKEKWRRILKTLFLIEHLLRVLGNKFSDSISSFSYLIKNLKSFRYEDESRNDKGGGSKLKKYLKF